MNKILTAAAKLPIDEQADFVKDCIELQSELNHLNNNNMTKISVFGQQSTEQRKELKKIEFVKCLNSICNIIDTNADPSEFSNVVLFEKKYGDSGWDIIFAWNNLNDKVIFLGHWNDGVV